jgi:hypothetical protein
MRNLLPLMFRLRANLAAEAPDKISSVICHHGQEKAKKLWLIGVRNLI